MARRSIYYYAPPFNEGSSHSSSWSEMTEEMVGGQHRNDEATQISGSDFSDLRVCQDLSHWLKCLERAGGRPAYRASQADGEA
jgi:hypothetical protein